MIVSELMQKLTQVSATAKVLTDEYDDPDYVITGVYFDQKRDLVVLIQEFEEEPFNKDFKQI